MHAKLVSPGPKLTGPPLSRPCQFWFGFKNKSEIEDRRIQDTYTMIYIEVIGSESSSGSQSQCSMHHTMASGPAHSESMLP